MKEVINLYIYEARSDDGTIVSYDLNKSLAGLLLRLSEEDLYSLRDIDIYAVELTPEGLDNYNRLAAIFIEGPVDIRTDSRIQFEVMMSLFGEEINFKKILETEYLPLIDTDNVQVKFVERFTACY